MAKVGGRVRRGRSSLVSVLAAGGGSAALTPELAAQAIQANKFGSKTEGKLWAEQTWEPWVNNLDTGEHQALYDYSGGGYYINNVLRKSGYKPGQYPNSNTTKLTSNIDAAMAKTTVPRDITVRRGMKSGVIDQLETGGIFKDKGFGSASVNPTHNWHNHMTEILVPKGTKAGYIGSFSSHASEYELLLARNTVYEVVKKGAGTSYDPTILRVIGQD